MAEERSREVHVSGLSAALIQYSRGLFVPENSAVAAIDAAARAAGMPLGWEITPEVGRLFQVFARAIGARRALEFGTFAGHGAYWLASAMPDGLVISMERDPAYAEVARAALAQAGVGERVEVRVGECRGLLPAIEAEANGSGDLFDIIFLDADKAHYPRFLDWSARMLRTGGVLFADNVLTSESWGGQTLLDPAANDPRILAIREFNRRLASHPDFLSLIAPMRAGVAIGLKIG